MKVIVLTACLALVSGQAFAQNASGRSGPAAASGAAVTDTLTTTAAQDTVGISGGELVLGEINIEAIIEKPNVDIIPSRVKPRVEDVAFIDRSFEHELKEIPKNFLLYDEALDSPKKLDQLFQLLRKKKSK